MDKSKGSAHNRRSFVMGLNILPLFFLQPKKVAFAKTESHSSYSSSFSCFYPSHEIRLSNPASKIETFGTIETPQLKTRAPICSKSTVIVSFSFPPFLCSRELWQIKMKSCNAKGCEDREVAVESNGSGRLWTSRYSQISRVMVSLCRWCVNGCTSVFRACGQVCHWLWWC